MAFSYARSSSSLPSRVREAGEPLWTVTGLTRKVRRLLEGQIGSLWVEGEVSNYRLQSSGHHYFTLKDDQSQISCCWFKGDARHYGKKLHDGQQIQIYGDISVYESRGQYQIIVRHVQDRGAGALLAKFEALKAKLQGEGLFATEKKKALPSFPGRIGIVTSPTGAALRDMLHILQRRAPWVEVIISPARVQGQGAHREIEKAIEIFERGMEDGLPLVDVIVLARGGGSIEDLWNFNEESLARVIAECRTPVVSAVGHEIDFTISDFVADHRAPTPSAAAEIVVPDGEELGRRLTAEARVMAKVVERATREKVQGVDYLESHLREPRHFLEAQEQALRRCRESLQRGVDEEFLRVRWSLERQEQSMFLADPEPLIRGYSERIVSDAERFERGQNRALRQMTEKLAALEKLLATLNVDSVLARGFSITLDDSQKVISDAESLCAGQKMITRFRRGSVVSKVVRDEK